MPATIDAAFRALEAHAATLAGRSLRDLFAEDPGRFDRFSRRLDDLLVDFSKQRIMAETLSLLLGLARAADVEGWRARMFSGEAINASEGRAVLHMALRADPETPIRVDGEDVMAAVAAERERFLGFAEAVRNGVVRGAGGEPFTDVVNIGIGGSDLGPAMATLALAPYRYGPRLHFVSNVDGAHLADTLRVDRADGLAPETTLFLIASKTFTTVETMTNARTAREWIARRLGERAVGRHFAAVSTAADKVAAFGITPDRVFGFWDWVGGRYSVWSAIGLPLAIAIGAEGFRAFLAGGREMDAHFRDAPLDENLPVLLALVGVWNRDVLGCPALAVIPYDQRLARFPAFLQQLDMESNGKRVDRDGRPVTRPTGPIVFGEPGTNAQHAFFQLLHQGTDVIPVDFLLAAEGHERGRTHHDLLVANCLAQSQALMQGRTREEAGALLAAAGLPDEAVEALAPHKVFPGDRPSTTILYRTLDPFTLGRLIALYEHKVFVQGVIWGVNSFDQWGVELGKELATGLLPVVRGERDGAGQDASTAGLVVHLHRLRTTEPDPGVGTRTASRETSLP